MTNEKLNEVLLQTFSAGYHYAKVFPNQNLTDADFEPIIKQLKDSFSLEPETELEDITEPSQPKHNPFLESTLSENSNKSEIEQEIDADMQKWFKREKQSANEIVEPEPVVDPIKKMSPLEIESARQHLDSTRDLRPFGKYNPDNTEIVEQDIDIEELDADEEPEITFPDLDTDDYEMVEPENNGPIDYDLDDMNYSKQIADILLTNDKELLALQEKYDVMFTDNVFVSVKQAKTRCIAFLLRLTNKSTQEVTYKTFVYRVANGKIDNVTEKLAKANMIPDTSSIKYSKSDLNDVDRLLQARELDDLIYQYGNEVFPEDSRTTYMNILRTLKGTKEPGMQQIYTWFIRNF